MITQKIIARTDSLKLDKIISRYGEDSMRQVVFIIVRPEPDSEELIPITIPEDAVGSFRILKPSGNFVIVPMNKSVLASGETAFDVVLPASANTAKGSGYYDIRITSNTDKYYFTAQGDFIIDDNIISDEVLEDVSEVNGLVFPDDFLTVEDNVAIIDDDTISTDSTWSSNKISEEIEAHAGGDVSKTVSGNPVIFTDGASAPLVKCVTEIQGSQDLHGYDKPWVGGAGKNLLLITTTSQTVNGITFTVNSDGTIKAVGTATARTALALATNDSETPLLNKSVIMNGCPSGGSTSTYFLQWYGFDGASASVNDIGSGTSAFTPTSTAGSIAIVIQNGVTVDMTFKPMVRLASVSDATFAPYSNICPITAYTEGEIEVRGKNLCNPSKVTHPSSQYIWGYKGEGFLFRAGTSYTLSINITVASTSIYSVDETTQLAYASSVNRVTYTPTEDTLGVLRFYGATALDFDNAHIQLEIGTSPTAYEPYTSTTHTTTYPSAIYRGSEDCVEGEVTSEKIKIQSDGTGFLIASNGILYNDSNILTGVSHFVEDLIQTITDKYAFFNIIGGTVDLAGQEGKFGLQIIGNVIRIAICDSRFTTAEDFRTYLANNPLEIVYKLATPTTSSVTPTNLPIKSLSGYNHIESSTGDMEVEYITQRFQPLIDSIKQL